MNFDDIAELRELCATDRDRVSVSVSTLVDLLDALEGSMIREAQEAERLNAEAAANLFAAPPPDEGTHPDFEDRPAWPARSLGGGKPS